MRVVIAGKGWLAVRAARLMNVMNATRQADRFTIAVVRNSDDPGVDTWLPSLSSLARSYGWAIHEDVQKADMSASDIFLSLQYDRIIRCHELNGAAAYNLHFAALPLYRGSLTSVLPIRHGQMTSGVTLHALVQEVDAGPVVATRSFDIPPFYTAYDLYRAYHYYGFELLKDHVQDLLTGAVKLTPQDESSATLFTRSVVDFRDVELTDFDRPAGAIRDWYRSLIFPPRQYPTYQGRPVSGCYDLCLTSVGASAGTVIHEDPAQVFVACRQGAVCLEFLADR